MAIWFIRRSIFRFKYWKITVGNVIDYEPYAAAKGICYRPKVQFLTPEGQTITFICEGGSGRKPYKIGSEVNVIFDPNNFQNADLQTNLWVGPIAGFFIGAGLAAISAYVLLFIKH